MHKKFGKTPTFISEKLVIIIHASWKRKSIMRKYSLWQCDQTLATQSSWPVVKHSIVLMSFPSSLLTSCNFFKVDHCISLYILFSTITYKQFLYFWFIVSKPKLDINTFCACMVQSIHPATLCHSVFRRKKACSGTMLSFTGLLLLVLWNVNTCRATCQKLINRLKDMRF